MATVDVTEPEMPLLVTLTALSPATTYSLVLTAYTTAAGGSGFPVALTTMESGEQLNIFTTRSSLF